MTAVSEQRNAVIARVARARAVFNGQPLVLHLSSLDTRRRVWALPGQICATEQELRRADPGFALIGAPSETELGSLGLRFAKAGGLHA